MTAVSTTVQSFVEAIVFFVPLLFFVAVMVRGSRRKRGEAHDDQSER